MAVRSSVKSTIFLSHSSSNRRELLALKRLLDARAGGLINFFLSSDDDSIAHGTIWPAEVKAALDRMRLMMIFVSPEALKSGWTYFEAGYGLHKLGTAKIYCLPGIDKAALPSPFNILQNRNLHGPRDIALLIRQINEEFNARLNETVSKADFDSVFRRPLLGRIDTAPRFSEVVERVSAKTLGPHNSADYFATACRQLGHPSSVAKSDDPDHQTWCSTGVRLAIEKIWLTPPLKELTVTPAMRKADGAEVVAQDDGRWKLAGDYEFTSVMKTLADIEAYNSSLPARNAAIARQNEARKKQPRQCSFSLVPLDFSVPTEIVDTWGELAESTTPWDVAIRFLPGVRLETRPETRAAKVHGSELAFQDDTTLIWRERSLIRLEQSHSNESPVLSVKARVEPKLRFSELQIEELVGALCEQQVLIAPERKKSRAR